jgi:hypothetical protein
LSEQERQAVYARALGVGGGPKPGQSNEQFQRLWQTFVGSVAANRRRPHPAVRKAAHHLAANLSRHGYGIGYFAASSLQVQINEAVRLLSLPEIRAAYGARNMWHVIEVVSGSELGGAVHVVRQRTLAASGLVIVRWLAGLGRPRPRSVTIPRYPELVSASEAWIAAAASDDT